MGTWGHHIGLRHLSWGSGEAVLQDGAPDGALLLRGHHWDVPIPCHRSFFLSQSLPWPGICRSTGFLPPGYISLLPSDVNLWLCPRVWWEPAEKEHCKWFLKCHLVTGWGEAPPPPTQAALTPGSLDSYPLSAFSKKQTLGCLTSLWDKNHFQVPQRRKWNCFQLWLRS